MIPFYHDEVWHVFYLNYRAERWNHTPPGARRTPWAHITSKDLNTWECHPAAVEPGPDGAVDSGSCATGAIFEHDGTFHLFYTGRYFTTSGERRETICRARSGDLVDWEKDSVNPISIPALERYAPQHWRDPFVFWNPDAREFWMVITAELKYAPTGRGGCLALLRSGDLEKWEPAGELRAPFGTSVPECPDVFRWNDWWYLIYSADGQTRYRYARNPRGPWRVPGRYDVFDGRYYYAAKSAGGPDRRLLFGWLADKEEDRDAGRFEWGGNLATRELLQREDGQLVTAHPAETHPDGSASCQPITPRLGRWAQEADGVRCESEEGFAYATAGPISPDHQLRLTISPGAMTRRCGLYLRTTDELSGGYVICVDLAEQLLSLASVDARTGRFKDAISRPTPAFTGELPVTVTADGSIIDVAVGESATLVGRFGQVRGETLALFSEDGPARFHGLAVAGTRPAKPSRASVGVTD